MESIKKQTTPLAFAISGVCIEAGFVLKWVLALLHKALTAIKYIAFW